MSTNSLSLKTAVVLTLEPVLRRPSDQPSEHANAKHVFEQRKVILIARALI